MAVRVVAVFVLAPPFETEINIQFPEEVMDYNIVQKLFKRGELNVLDDLGIPRKKIPYYLETTPEVEKFFYEPPSDTWSAKLIKKADDAYYALPFTEEGKSILVKGKSGMKPFI